MRKKALLAGALSGYEGPWVNLESGEWLVEPSGDAYIEFGKGVIECPDTNTFRGPARIRAVVSPTYTGAGIFLSAKQTSTGATP